MTVYVDDYRVPATIGGGRPARWSHMFAGPFDDIAELHAVAAAIGMRREWFQDKDWPRQHYDVTDTRRRAALAAGAVPVSAADGARMRMEARRAVVRETGMQLTAPSEAFFDQDRCYRYALTRTWDESRPPVTFIMLNPSTADAFRTDPTVTRCLTFARREGCGGIRVVNLFALRSTDPRELRKVADPEGPLNDAFIRGACPPGRAVIAAWGAHGTLAGRAGAVAAMLAGAGVRLHCLGVTGQGHPRHPLYVPAGVLLQPYDALARAAGSLGKGHRPLAVPDKRTVRW